LARAVHRWRLATVALW